MAFPDFPPLFPPLFPTPRWWRLYMERMLKGSTDGYALSVANHASGLPQREWMRFRLKDDTLISIPTAGSASALKNHPGRTWRLSPKAPAEARKADLTVATLYGNTPYCHLLADRLSLRDLTARCPGGYASELCFEAWMRVKEILQLDDEDLLDEIRANLRDPSPVFIEKTKELRLKADDDISIIDALMRYGKETLFLIIPDIK